MNLENTIKALSDAASRLLASAAQRDELASVALPDDVIPFDQEDRIQRRIAERLRVRAGELISAINHLNGVSPE